MNTLQRLDFHQECIEDAASEKLYASNDDTVLPTVLLSTESIHMQTGSIEHTTTVAGGV